MIIKTFWVCNKCDYEMSERPKSYRNKCGGEFVKQEWICVEEHEKAIIEVRYQKCPLHNAVEPVERIIKEFSSYKDSLKKAVENLRNVEHNRVSHAKDEHLIHLWLSEIRESLFGKATTTKEVKK
jgi:hypothetical protein